MRRPGDIGLIVATAGMMTVVSAALAAPAVAAPAAAAPGPRQVLYALGSNTFGELGDGTTTASYSPVRVSGLTGVVNVAAGSYYALALRQDGTVWAWGDNADGNLGDGTTAGKSTPQYTGLADITQVAVGGTFLFDGFSAAVRNDGTLLAWGCNGFGQLGLGAGTGPVETPTPVTALTGVSQIAFGGEMQRPFEGGAYSLIVASAPVVPNLKGDTPAGAHLALQAAGLVVGTISYVTDYSCDNIGRVSGQDPPAGTTVYYGSAVSITIGERPPPPHLCP